MDSSIMTGMIARGARPMIRDSTGFTKNKMLSLELRLCLYNNICYMPIYVGHRAFVGLSLSFPQNHFSGEEKKMKLQGVRNLRTKMVSTQP